MTTAMNDISHVIQFAIAPVFMLTAIGTKKNKKVTAQARRHILLPQIDSATGRTKQEAVAIPMLVCYGQGNVGASKAFNATGKARL